MPRENLKPFKGAGELQKAKTIIISLCVTLLMTDSREYVRQLSQVYNWMKFAG